jgi:hypothetical protein
MGASAWRHDRSFAVRGDRIGTSRWEETGINFLFFRLQLLPTLKLLYKIKISGPSYPPTLAGHKKPRPKTEPEKTGTEPELA